MPIIPLQVVQQGVETTRGTAVAATSALDFEPGSAALSFETEVLRVRRAGSLASAHRAYVTRKAASVELRNLPLTYQWLPTWFNVFLGPLATGSGAGADKTWTFDSTVISDAADNLKSLTLEVGGRDTWPQEYKLAGCVGQRFEISIEQNEVWRGTASLLGTTLSEAAKTAAINPLSGLVDVLGATTKVYVDTSSAFGTTQRVGTVLSGSVSIELAVDRIWTLDASTAPRRVALLGPRQISARLVVDWSATTDYTGFQAATAQRVRIESVGPTLGASAYKATLDVGGVWTEYALADSGGLFVTELSLAGLYDSSIGADIKAVVVNDRGTLP